MYIFYSTSVTHYEYGYYHIVVGLLTQMYTVMYYNGIRLVSRIIHLWHLGCPHTYTHAHTAQNFIMIKLKTWKCSYIQNLYDYGSNTKGEKPAMTMSVVTNSKINSLQNQVKWLQLLIWFSTMNYSLLWSIHKLFDSESIP